MSLHRSCSSSFESCLSNCLAIGRSEERWCLAESSSSKGFIRHSSVVALVKSWLSMGRCERCSSAAEHGKGDTRDAGGGRGISTGRAGGTRRSRGDLPRRAPGSRLFEDSVVATRRSGRLGSAGREALNAPACGLAARSGARAAEMTQGGPSPESHRLEQQQGGPSPVSHRLAAGCRRARGSRRARARSGRGDPPRRGCRR